MSYDHCVLRRVSDCGREGQVRLEHGVTDARDRETLTLDADMDVVLRLLGFASILIGLGEGVCEAELVKSAAETGRKGSKTGQWAATRTPACSPGLAHSCECSEKRPEGRGGERRVSGAR